MTSPAMQPQVLMRVGFPRCEIDDQGTRGGKGETDTPHIQDYQVVALLSTDA